MTGETSPALDWLDLALFVGLAAEFQGYCRDLHDDVASRIARSVRPVADSQFWVIRSALVRGRKLDTGNVQPASLGSDFHDLGLTLWHEIGSVYPDSAQEWRITLSELNGARNAIVHSTDSLPELARDRPLDSMTFERWRRSLDALADGLDRIVGAYLVWLTGSQWEEGSR